MEKWDNKASGYIDNLAILSDIWIFDITSLENLTNFRTNQQPLCAYKPPPHGGQRCIIFRLKAWHKQN